MVKEKARWVKCIRVYYRNFKPLNDESLQSLIDTDWFWYFSFKIILSEDEEEVSDALYQARLTRPIWAEEEFGYETLAWYEDLTRRHLKKLGEADEQSYFPTQKAEQLVEKLYRLYCTTRIAGDVSYLRWPKPDMLRASA